MAKPRTLSEELGIDPAQGTDALLAQAGELIIGGRLYTAAPASRTPAEPAPAEPAESQATEKDGE